MPITVNGRQVMYTGTSHRILLWEVYAPAMKAAGWFGFGDFDLNAGEFANLIEPQLRQLFYSVDNAYLVQWLNRGSVGALALFALVLVAALAALTAPQDRELAVFNAATAGAIAGLVIVLGTVWFDPDYGAWVLMAIGMVATWLPGAQFSSC